ncbi:hypothetical protein GIB67_001611 [Kingdonia uniflora]|uniref:RRM domain-containing protein n=1 Tax=Kingdonia uniflora TaxID=39325 RepID=A0A7J7L0W1_9MAGN|nr:hypothetical protein GIB67_001611 [Kingdonia uniflora]
MLLGADQRRPPPKSQSQSPPCRVGGGGLSFDLNEPWCEEESEEIKEEIVIKKQESKKQLKQKEYEVFVGGLDRDAVDDDLFKVFNKVGQVVEVRIVKSKYSQKNKGFAFVRFATVDQAKRAAFQLNYTQIRGRICEVRRKYDNETLHLGNICTTWTKDTLVQKLNSYELQNLLDVQLIEDPSDKSKNRGYAFLNFSTHMDAVAASNKLQRGDAFFGTSVRADVAFAISAVEPDEEVMAQVKSIFLDGVPESWDEQHVVDQFKKYGEIINVQLARNMPSAKRKDFGFISFRTRDSALACIDAVNNGDIDEGSQKVLLKATLRKPLHKRVPTASGGWRGYNSRNHDFYDQRPRGFDRSYPSRPSIITESFGRDRDPHNRDRRRYSNRGDEFDSELSQVDEYDSHYRRGAVQQLRPPATARRRSRDPYVENSSSSRRSSKNYQDMPSSSARVPSHGRYEDDDSYDPQFDYYEESPAYTYDYPSQSRPKRRYSTIDDDSLDSRSFARHARSRGSNFDMESYPVHEYTSYEEYARSVPDDKYIYGNTDNSSQYVSGRGPSRSYYH